LGTLSQLAEASRGTRGRKNVIWVGSGYPSIDTTTLKFDDKENLQSIIRRVTGHMLAARMTLYLIDPNGVATGGGGDSGTADDTGMVSAAGSMVGPFEGSLDFATFAPATGGEIFANRNDIDVAIAQSVRDGGVYYTLSYIPTGEGDQAQQYRQIRVKLKDPSLHAVTRDGYFAGTEEVDPIPVGKEKPSNQLQFNMVSAARTRLAYNGLNVQTKPAHDGYDVLVGMKGLHWSQQADQTQVADVTVMVVFFNGKDKELKSQAFEQKEKISADVQTYGSTIVLFTVPVEAPKGTERVRVIVRDAESGILGTADLHR
jgi:hypothetical protein